MTPEDDERRRRLAETRFQKALSFLAESSEAPRRERELKEAALRSERELKRRRSLYAMIAVCVAVLLVAVVGSVLYATNAQKQQANTLAVVAQATADYTQGGWDLERELWDEAIGEFTSAIAGYAKSPDTRIELANAYGRRGVAYDHKNDRRRMVEDYNRAIETYAGTPVVGLANAYNNRGAAYYAAGQNDKAVADYTKAIALYKRLDRRGWELANTYYNRGLIADHQKKYQSAIEDYSLAIGLFQKASKKKSLLGDAYNARGIAYENLGEGSSAIRDFTAALQHNANDATAFAFRGEAHAVRGEYGDAVHDFDRALEITPHPAWIKSARDEAAAKLAAAKRRR